MTRPNGTLGGLQVWFAVGRNAPPRPDVALTVQLEPIEVEAPCADCCTRAASGLPANPFHSCCSARLASRAVER